MNIKIIFKKTLPLLLLLVFINVARADTAMLSRVRVTYMPNGSVAITRFVTGACDGGETETQCMDRIMQKSPELAVLPHDDVDPATLPQDFQSFDKWRGEKGKGIWIDNSLVTKREKMDEIQGKLDQEFNKDNPDTAKVLKLQHQIEKVKKIKNNVLSQDDLAQFEEKKKSFIASAIDTIGGVIGDILNSIKDGFLALKNLVIGSPETPSGVTIYDIKTKEPYCSVVLDGQNVNIPGACSAEVIANYLQGDSSSPSAPQNDSGGVILNTSEGSQDTEPPAITLNGANPSQVEVGSVYSDMGATVTDNVSQNLGYKVILKKGDVILSGSEESPEIYPNELTLDTSAPAEYTITYIATDQAGNTGTTTRQVVVSDPNTPPAEEPPPEEPPSEP